MEFKERVLKLIAYYLYVAESKMKVSAEEKENIMELFENVKDKRG